MMGGRSRTSGLDLLGSEEDDYVSYCSQLPEREREGGSILLSRDLTLKSLQGRRVASDFFLMQVKMTSK